MKGYQEYIKRVDIMSRFINLYGKYMSSLSSSEDSLSSFVERHLLISINDSHGITNVELASALGRTPGAITQIIVKLEQKGLVERVKHKDNAKTVHIYPTPAGVRLAISYQAQEIINMRRMLYDIQTRHSQEEIDTFWNVMSDFLTVISDLSV